MASALSAALRPGSAVHYLDLQPFLERVCDQMHVGELVHGEAFSLFESLTAIEIGDPKMDLGLRRHQDTGTPEELIAAGHAPIDLSAAQLLGLMDQLMVMEAAWHCGAMLPQTVFTSLYMLQTDRLAGHPVLQAFCLGLKSACTMVRDMVINGQVCEDEDFSVYTFGITLDPPGPSAAQASLHALTEMEEYLRRQVKSDAEEAKVQKLAGGAPGPPHLAGVGLETSRALLARVRFRRLFHLVLQHMARGSRASVEEACKDCKAAVEELQRMRETCHLAPEADHPGFVPEINRRHMGLVPPRPLKLLSREDMVDHFSSLLMALSGVCHSLLGVRTWGDLTEGVLVPFAAQPSSPITRSAMHLLVANPIKLSEHSEVTAAAATAAAARARGSKGSSPRSSPKKGGSEGGGVARRAGEAPPAWCPTQQMVCSEFGWRLGELPGADVAMFVEQCAIAMQAWCHTLCLNRARQRRRLRHLLEDWRNMYDHGINADISADLASWMTQQGWRWMPLDEAGDDPQGPVATWVEKESCKSMVAHLMLGFQLGLYLPYEYRAVYWYCDYLLGTEQQATKFLFAARPAPAQQAQRPRAARRGKEPAQAPLPHDAMLEEQKKTVEIMSLEIERMMCQGMMKMATGLHVLGCVQAPDGAFNGEEQRFAQRFAAFHLLAKPPPLCYGHYEQSMQTNGLAPDYFFTLAFENFFKAQHGAVAMLQGPPSIILSPDQVNHLNGIKRVAAQNSMALKIMITTLRDQQQQQQQQGHLQQLEAGAGEGQAAEGEERGVQQQPKEGGAQQRRQQQQQEGAGQGQQVQRQQSPFTVSWDFKTALQSSVSMYYPAVALRTR